MIRNNYNEYVNSPVSARLRPDQIGPELPNVAIKFDVNKFFIEYNASEVPVNTYYPILQKRLAGSLKNISIEGNMMTNYDGVTKAVATHGYSLIQVGKASSGLANALGGYGVAWKPLTSSESDPTAYDVDSVKRVGVGEYEITLTDPYPVGPPVGFPTDMAYLQIPYRDTATFVFVPIQFVDYLDDGVTVRCLSGNTELIDGLSGSAEVALYLTKPNVFIIDFTASVNDINLWDNLSDEMGFLSFVNCGVADIRPDIDYKFTLTITEEGGIQFDIEDPAFTVTGPARIPMYEYVKVEDTDSIGFSVYGTDGYKWYYDNIRITSLDEQYPYLYCIFSTEGLRDNIYIKTTARGYKEETADTGMKIYVCNSSGVWELIGYNSGENIQSISSDVIIKDDYTFRGAIHVILIGMQPGDFEGNSTLEVDTVSAENSESIATHLGGFVDAYIDAACTEMDIVQDVDPETNSLYIDNSTYGIVHIISIARDGVTLIPLTDYTLSLDDYAYSCRGSITISTRYTSGEFTIKALVCPGLVTIFNAMEAKDINPLGYDLLVKHRKIHYLDIAGTNRATILPYLTSYIDTLPRVDGVIQFSYAQFIFYLLQNSVTTSSLIITDHYTDDGFIQTSYLRQSSDTIELDKISCFRVSSGQ